MSIKFFAKEFLWVLMVLLLSIPLALILRYAYCEIAPNEVEITVDEMLNGNSLLIAAYGVSIAGIYFTRTTVGAIKTLTKKEAK